MTPRTFKLEVTSTGAPGSYRIAAASDRQGEDEAVVSFDPAAEGFETVSDLLKRPVSLQDLQTLGSRLCDVLFAGSLRSLFYAALGEVQGNEELILRLCLRIDPPELTVLPWEILYLAERDRFLAASPRITLSRSLLIPQPIRSLLLPKEIRLLLLVPATSGLDTDSEVQELQRWLEPVARVEIVRPATRQRIREALRTADVHLVHYAGHGSFQDEEATIFLDGTNGLPDPVPGVAFAELFRDRTSLRLVVLSSCEGASRSSARALAGTVPQLLQREIPAVIAMQSAIKNSAAEAFTATFYAELIEGRQSGNVEVALSRARGALLQDRLYSTSLVSPLFASPVLYLRSEGGELWQREAVFQRTVEVLDPPAEAPAAKDRPGTEQKPTEEVKWIEKPFKLEMIKVQEGPVAWSCGLRSAAAGSVVSEFFISKSLITNSQFDTYLEATRATKFIFWPRRLTTATNLGTEPAKVAWYEAVAFSRWVRQVTALPVRLPTEAEWVNMASGQDKIHLALNLYEWCADGFSEEGADPARDPVVMKAYETITHYRRENTKTEYHRVCRSASGRSRANTEGGLAFRLAFSQLFLDWL